MKISHLPIIKMSICLTPFNDKGNSIFDIFEEQFCITPQSFGIERYGLWCAILNLNREGLAA